MKIDKKSTFLSKISAYVKRNKFYLLVVGILFVVVGYIIGVSVLYAPKPPKGEEQSIVKLLLSNSYISFGNGTDTMLIAFVDLGCPFCARFWLNTFPLIKHNYLDKGKLIFIIRDFPIPQLHGVNPFYAAQYARCVVKESGDPYLYIPVANALYRNRTVWLRLDYVNLSHYLLNLIPMKESLHNRIVECYYNNDTAYDVYYDYMTARSLKIMGTPAFFLLTPTNKLNTTEIKEIKDELAKYGLNVTIISVKWDDKNYYLLHFLGALPYQTFNYILSRATS